MATGTNTRRVLLFALTLAGCGFLCWQVFRHRPADLTVYLAGAQALLDGKPLYESVAVPSGTLILPFTYPPFAAVVMIPFALLPLSVTLLIWALLCLASLGGIAYLTAARLPFLAGISRPTWPTWQLALAIFGVSAFAEPIIQNFDLGQVNLMIVVAVLYDTVNRTRYAGFATGIAAGFKVTPGLFMVFMLVTRRWADFGRAMLGLAVTLVIGSFFGLGQVWQFWTVELFATDRVGNPRRYSNLGISGVLQRSLSSDVATIIWGACAVILVVVALWFAAKWWTRSKLVSATLVGMATVLISPISWPHHWVWLVPGVACALALGIRAFRQGDRRSGLLLLIGAAVTGVPALTQLRFQILEAMLAVKAPGVSVAAGLYAAGGVVLVVALGVSSRLIPADATGPFDADSGETAGSTTIGG